MTEPASPVPYEKARDQLAEVVRRLESGGLTLEESLELWEQGERLAAVCSDWLEGARARLTAATPDPAGRGQQGRASPARRSRRCWSRREAPAMTDDHTAALPGEPGPVVIEAPEPERQAPDRNLALELVRVTEAGAMAAARWVGRGDKNGADAAAVHAMRLLINTVSMNGVVVIGEGEKDQAPMLFNGEEVGDGSGPACDVAVDPIDGTRLTANGMPNAISVLAVSARGSMYDPSAVFYMSKLVTGPAAADVVDIEAPVADNIAKVARAKSCSPQDVTVVILDRPRHAQLVSEVRAAGARIQLITDGDVAGAIMAARDGTGVDLLLGIGGTPEGIIAACAIKCLGGTIQGRLAPRDEAERQRAIDAGHDLKQVLTTDDLVASEDAFFAATGITDGELLAGVRYRAGGATSHSLVMRARSGTIRTITSEHQLWKLRAYSSVNFDSAS